MFECDACGHCCRNLDKSSIYSELDRVDESYEKFFKDIMSLEEYYKLNCEACIRLKEEAKKNKY